MLLSYFNNISLFFGYIFILITLFYLALELLLRFKDFLKYSFFYKKIKRQDFLDPKYHNYINWTDSWNKAMFDYFPSGVRFHNIKNTIPQVKYNKHGFRCDELNKLEKLDSKIRKVIFIGSSAGWGFGATSNNTTISAYLENLLNHENTEKFKVINLCQVNQTQTQDMQILIWLLPILKPDMVIHFGGWNELISSSQIRSKEILKYQMIPIDEMLDWKPIKAGSNAFNTLLLSLKTILNKRSYLARYLSEKLYPEKSYNVRSIRKNIDIFSNLFVENISRMRILANSYNSSFLQVFQPNIFRKRFLTPGEIKVIDLYKNFRQAIGNFDDIRFLEKNDFYSYVLRKEKFNKKNTHTLNLNDIFLNDKDNCFFSLVHCRDEGYEKIAKNIFDYLNKYIL